MIAASLVEDKKKEIINQMQRSKVAQIYKVKTDKHDTYGNCFTLQDQGGETQPIGQNWRVKKEQGTKGTIKRLAWIAASKGGQHNKR